MKQTKEVNVTGEAHESYDMAQTASTDGDPEQGTDISCSDPEQNKKWELKMNHFNMCTSLYLQY